MAKPFFFRIDAAALIDFATDPEGENMSLLRFAKELQKGQSQFQYIQGIITEAVEYIEKKKQAGSSGGKAKRSSAKAKRSSAKAKSSTPLASSSNIKEETITIPSFIPESEWNDFLLNRERMKKPMSDLAITKMFSKLEKLKENYDIAALLNRSVLNNWQDVFVDDCCKKGVENTTPHWF